MKKRGNRVFIIYLFIYLSVIPTQGDESICQKCGYWYCYKFIVTCTCNSKTGEVLIQRYFYLYTYLYISYFIYHVKNKLMARVWKVGVTVLSFVLPLFKVRNNVSLHHPD